MVSAKFHIAGEDSEWFRIRVLEEVHAHGLEGNVILAGEKSLAVVVEGEKSRVKRFYTDIQEFCPEHTELTELVFSLQKLPRGMRMKGTAEKGLDVEYIMQLLKEIERTTMRLDQKVNTLIAMHEGYAGAEVIRQSEESFEEKEMDVEDDAVGGFAAMFGD